MNYYQKQKNPEIGEYVRQLRENAGHTQETLATAIAKYEEEAMERAGIDNEELREIAISTISRYENGTQLIPATYVALVKKICDKH